LRQLRNKFVHEYIEDIETLVDAIIVSRDGVSTLISFGRNLIGETESRLGQAK
jgi:plasmid maintenance system antidote protein VapI